MANSEFAKYTMFDATTQEWYINRAAVNEAYGNKPEVMDAFNQFDEEITSLRDTYRDNQNTLEDMADDLEELKLTGKEEYLSLFEEVKQSIIDRR
jgi:archaellum component FlaC